MQRFQTKEQEERARNLAAYGPLGRTQIDNELDALGWTERYDGDVYSTDLRPEAARAMFDHLGRLTDAYAVRED